ncbi:hypothetical protein FQN50_008684 [Emmonsiellopsis sp. PD_5]|nr:hypothetical protein FQN50_008684 [Emmonsiellopsis sp. PD_5]
MLAYSVECGSGPWEMILKSREGLRDTSLFIVAAFIFVTIYVAIRLIYRLYISPLSKFPGPRLAAATLWYEFYYDAVLKGRYTFKIKELHKKYGPIIRISPYELHIDDPEYYHVLYSYSPARDKYYYYLKPFDFPLSAFGTESHRAHRFRRRALNPFFFRQRVAQHERLVQTLVQKFCKRIDEFDAAGKIVPISLGYVCLITDLITSYVLDTNYQYLDTPDWFPHWRRALGSASEMVMISRQVTWVLSLLKCVPQSWTAGLDPGLALFFRLAGQFHQKVNEIWSERNLPRRGGNMKPSRGYTLVDQVMDSILAPGEKTPDRLIAEIRSTISAGIETTSNALTVTTYHMLENPTRLQRCREELLALEPDPRVEFKACDLEKLPYLTSVVLEGLRYYRQSSCASSIYLS